MPIRQCRNDRVTNKTLRQENLGMINKYGTGRHMNSHDNKTILLVDDTELFLKLEQTFLQRSGIEILTARNGSEALKLASMHRPDVVFLDLNMPEMNGDECCLRIKQDDDLKNIAVVMVTAAGRSSDIERCKASGCDEILLKPINRTEFLVTAEKMLNLPTRDNRYKVSIKVHYGQSTETPLTKFSADFSSGGLFLSSEEPLPVGESLLLRFSLEGFDRDIKCQAEVAWVNDPVTPQKKQLPAGMGIRFVDLSIDDLRAVRNFIENSDLKPSW